MWLCTKHGFFSIVEKLPGEFHVRGRLRHDIDNLLKLCGAELATAIDYSNFKSRIHAEPDQTDKSAAYSKLWSNLYELQG